MSTTYRVEWSMEIDADSPEEAARKALAIHRDPESVATVFDVYDEAGEVARVDLLELDEATSGEAAH